MKVLVYFLLCYLLFFGRMLSPNAVLKSGKDIMRLSYPVRYHLYNNLKIGEFPFWTEKMFSGYPIYLEGEAGYLNVPNIILVYIFGPMNSFKVLHFLTYLVGATFFYKFLRNRDFTIGACALCHIIYFFNFFSLFHQQHQAITFSYYLFPAFIWALNKYVNTSKIKYLLFWGLIFTHLLYFGAFQMLFIITMVSMLFVLVHKKILAVNIRHYILLILLLVAMCLPLISGYLDIYKKSERADASFSWLEGSFSPIQLINLVNPFTYRQQDFYLGSLVNKEFNIQEIYIYIGVIAFILSILGILYSKLPRKDSMFLIFLIGIFLTLGFAKNNPVFNYLTIPGVSLFRYWGRLVFIAIFALSVFAGHFYSMISKRDTASVITINKSGLKIIAFFCAYILLMSLCNLQNSDFKNTLRVLLRDDYRLDYWYLYIPMLFLGLGMFFAAIFNKHNYLYKFRKFIFAAIFLDILIFGLIVLKGWYINVKDLYIVESLNNDNFKNTRIVVTDGDVRGNTFLYHDFWSPFGLSASTDSQYNAALKKTGFSSISQVESKDSIESKATLDKNFLDGIDSLGIKAVVNSQGRILYQNTNLSMFYLESPAQDEVIESVEQNEMKHQLKVTSGRQVKISSYIRYDPSWKLTLNGKLQKIEQKGMFLEFTVPKGQSTITLQYIPTIFFNNIYKALLFSLVSIFLIILTERRCCARE